MKSNLLLVLGALIAFSVAAGGQEVSSLTQTTLYSYRHHRDWREASINFEPREAGSVWRNFDLTYGNLTLNDDNDWFQVGDSRSMIRDLGAKQWEDFKETPSFFKGKKPKKPLPLKRPMVLDASAGVKEHSPYQQFVRVKPGHMYLMRVVQEHKRTYVMFRVETLTTKDNCVLSWKKVPPPSGDVENE